MTGKRRPVTPHPILMAGDQPAVPVPTIITSGCGFCEQASRAPGHSADLFHDGEGLRLVDLGIDLGDGRAKWCIRQVT